MRLSLVALILSGLATGCFLGPTRSVCVLDYQVISAGPEHTHLARAIPEFLTHELSQNPRLEVQDPQDVDRYLSDLEQRWTVRDHSRLQGLGMALGSDYFVLGSVTSLGPRFVVESRLFSIERGAIVPGTAFRRICQDEQDILMQIESIAEQLRHQILARTPEPKQQTTRSQ
ncbi:hypothetical protein JXA47_09800 [Candidatus Sumerlaeota bacterium]|nr:hypothetical protein [Candidatus Sumerlaeota bacterium]